MDMPITWTNKLAEAGVRHKSMDIVLVEVQECAYCLIETPVMSMGKDEDGALVCPFCLK
jgi:hypothetical protein